MKPTEKQGQACAKEVERFGNLPVPFGVDRATLKIELSRALLKYAKDLKHAGRVVQQIIETAIVCPTVAELITVTREVSADATGLPEPCNKCAADGGYWVHQMAIKDVGFGTQEYHYSGRCNCARGRELGHRDRAEQPKIDYAHV